MRLCRINRPKAAIITAKQRLLIMVEKCEAVERECARAEGVGSGERKARTAKQPPGPAREHQPSEFFPNRAEGRKGSAAQSKIGEPPIAEPIDRGGRILV